MRCLAAQSTREFHRDACQSVARSSAVWFQPETVQSVDQTVGTRSADYLRFLAEAEMKAVDSDQCLDMDDADDFELISDREAAVLTGPRVYLEDSPMSSSAKRACAIPLAVSRILAQPDIGMESVPLPVPEDVNSTPHTSHFLVFHSTLFNVTLTLAQVCCV